MTDVIFSDVNLTGARIDNVNLSGASIDNAFIKGMTIYGIEIEPLLTKEIRQRAGHRTKDR